MADQQATGDNALKWFIPGLVIGLIVGMAIGVIVPPFLDKAAVIPPAPGGASGPVSRSTAQPPDRQVRPDQAIETLPTPAPTGQAPVQPAPDRQERPTDPAQPAPAPAPTTPPAPQ